MTISVRNPRTGEVDLRFEEPTHAELESHSDRLRSLQRQWEHGGLLQRVDAMKAWRARLTEARASIVDALIADTGRRIESELEVDAILGSIDRWCAVAPDLLAEPDARTAAIPLFSIKQSMRPYQLVGVISPWNFPLLLSLIDAIPALIAGCAVIIKPSEIAPRFIDAVAPTIDALPLVYVAGAGETGAAIVDLVDCVCFTGSVATGRRVGEQAAKRFIPAFLELGGKDPAVVLASADIERATSAILWGSTANTGQSCLSIERVYVDRSIYEPFVQLLAEKARAIKPAAPNIEDGLSGPIIAEKQIAIIDEHLAEAKAKGARVHSGGDLEEINGGTYLRPTVLTDVDHSMKVMNEETFGPIIPVMPFDSVEQAIELANDSNFGLSAAVFGEQTEALEVAARIDAGAVSVNDAALTALVHDAEKNSFNLSGLGGSRMGPAALRRFGRRQAYLIATTQQPDPWWYPTS